MTKRLRRKVTAFEQKVYDLCSRIPKGKTMTYADIARILDSSPIAVGQALKRNPYAPSVPCHRVIHSDGRVGGYDGVRNSLKKIRMLKAEGVRIAGRRSREKVES